MVDMHDPAALRALIGQEIAVSDWVDVSQDRINQFAETTDDRQWIHVDAARAATESPFGTTIAHGFLTLSLISVLTRTAVSFAGLRLAINYGLNRVRFVSPVRSVSPPAITSSCAGRRRAASARAAAKDAPSCAIGWRGRPIGTSSHRAHRGC